MALTHHLSGFERAMRALDGHGIPRENGAGKKFSLVERIELLGRSVPELVGAVEAAKLLGTTASNLPRWRDMPAPVAILSRGAIDLRAEVEALARERGRR
jgi:hypothetical protein